MRAESSGYHVEGTASDSASDIESTAGSGSEMGGGREYIPSSKDVISSWMSDIEETAPSTEATDNSDIGDDEVSSEDEEEQPSGKTTKGKPKVPDKKQEVGNALGKGFDQYTIKVPLKNYMKKNIKPNILNVCKHLRNVVFRQQLFVNDYIISNCRQELPKCIFQSNFWYSVGQMVMGAKKVTNSKNIPEEIVSHWKSFSKKYPDIIYRETIPKGFAQSCTESSKDLQTIYRNMIVENYKERIATYLKYRIRTEFKVSLSCVFISISFYLTMYV
jgi:hypothetical protein